MIPRAITGVGIVSAFGTGKGPFFDAMRKGEGAPPPPAPVASFDATKYGASVPIVEVPGFDPTKVLGDKGLRVLDRLTKLLLVAARLALQDAGYKKDGAWVQLSPAQVGVCCSNAYGSLESITELDRVAKLEDARYINPAKFPNTVSNSASGYVSIWEDLRALNVSVSDGNCGALDAFACADIFLAARRADAILTGGGEAMSEALFLAFQKLGALRPARLGEGAAFLAVETVSGARERGASELAHVVGYGTSFVAPEDESALVFASREATARAIASALDDAGVSAGDIDVVASSVSGLSRVDDEELAGVERALGDVAVCAPKLALGETLGAGGAMGVATGLAWLAGAPVTSLVRGRAPAKVEHVLVTAVGYYGNASAVVLRAPRA